MKHPTKRGAKRASTTEVRIEKSELKFEGAIFSVTRDTVVEPGGIRVIRDVVHHAGSAVILPRRNDGRVLLVRQFRLAPRRYLWELPAGRLDPGETPEQAAARELIEETGLRAGRLELLARFFPTPGLLDEQMWLFLAEDLRRGAARPEDDEVIQRRWFTPSQFDNMVGTGRIEDGKTLVGYFLLRHRRGA